MSEWGEAVLGSSTGGGARDSSERSSGDEVNTPTLTASTLSIPTPVTPQDYDALPSSVTTLKGLVFGGSGKFDKEKSLPPPLPTGRLRTPGSSTNLKATVTTNTKSTRTGGQSSLESRFFSYAGLCSPSHTLFTRLSFFGLDVSIRTYKFYDLLSFSYNSFPSHSASFTFQLAKIFLFIYSSSVLFRASGFVNHHC